jgi:hypothetical protein
MAIDRSKPLLRLLVGQPERRPVGKKQARPKTKAFSIEEQQKSFGPKFDRLVSVLEKDRGGLELKSDPSALAPERLLVFELRGTVSSFMSAVRNVQGLEFIDEEELETDEHDKNPALYLLVPDARALNEIASLWRRWVSKEPLGHGFSAWRDVFSTLRDIRAWGPQDRVHELDRRIIAEEISQRDGDELIRLEIELVFRAAESAASLAEDTLGESVRSKGGRIVSRCRIPEIGYHAILAELNVSEARSIVELSPTSIAGLESVMHVQPQSMATSINSGDINDSVLSGITLPAPSVASPILALIDGVPVSQHDLLIGSLVVDDQFDLERLSQVSDRYHGTAMSSLIVNGDRNNNEQRLARRIHVIPVLGALDKFPEDRLIIDMIYIAILAMRSGREPTAPDVLIVNISLGNSRKPFQGQMSAWARLIDRLSYQYGILFVISAGNHTTPFNLPNFTRFTEFEDSDDGQRTQGAVNALGQLIPERRLLSPAESVNAVTIGASNLDSVSDVARRNSRAINPFPGLLMANPSSAVGPGFANCVKPDLLMPGGKEHLRNVAGGAGVIVEAARANAAHGLRVAVPPPAAGNYSENYTSGTSASAALASRTCHQIHDALEEAYGDAFVTLGHRDRAVLLKALLVHTAKWPEETSNLIQNILGPADPRLHVRRKDNVRRFLGYGIADPDAAISCVDDRATFWSCGSLARERAVKINVPIPVCVSGKAGFHSLHATLAWLTPIIPGRRSYRAVRLKLIEPNGLASLRVEQINTQPDTNQGRRGTVFSRLWEGLRAPTIGDDHELELFVQREPDQSTVIDEPIPFALAVSFSMPGVMQIYEEVRDRLGIAPRVTV